MAPWINAQAFYLGGVLGQTQLGQVTAWQLVCLWEFKPGSTEVFVFLDPPECPALPGHQQGLIAGIIPLQKGPWYSVDTSVSCSKSHLLTPMVGSKVTGDGDNRNSACSLIYTGGEKYSCCCCT